MINQGEIADCKGHFRQLVGDSWNIVRDLTAYDITALIVNERNNVKYVFSTIPSTESKKYDGLISIVEDTVVDGDGTSVTSNNAYTFKVTSAQTKKMLGDCTIEVALVDKTTKSPLITDRKGRFTVQDSLLGRLL